MSSSLFVVATAILSRMLGALPVPAGQQIFHRSYMDEFAFVLQLSRLPALHSVLAVFCRAAGLRINVAKCYVIPLWSSLTSDTVEAIRGFLSTQCAALATIPVSDWATYLGVAVGPAGDTHRWEKALVKFERRTAAVSGAKQGALSSVLFYNSHAVSVLSYLQQFDLLPRNFCRKEIGTLAKIMHGAWAGMPREVLFNLSKCWHGPSVLSAVCMNVASMMHVALFREATLLQEIMQPLDQARDECLLGWRNSGLFGPPWWPRGCIADCLRALRDDTWPPWLTKLNGLSALVAQRTQRTTVRWIYDECLRRLFPQPPSIAVACRLRRWCDGLSTEVEIAESVKLPSRSAVRPPRASSTDGCECCAMTCSRPAASERLLLIARFAARQAGTSSDICWSAVLPSTCC